MSDLPISACRSCGAKIIWFRTVNNKYISVGAAPVE